MANHRRRQTRQRPTPVGSDPWQAPRHCGTCPRERGGRAAPPRTTRAASSAGAPKRSRRPPKAIAQIENHAAPSARPAITSLGHPAAVFFAAVLAGFALLGLISIALGLLVNDVLLDSGGIARDDESVVKSIVAERTALLTDASAVGSTLGGAPLLPILVGLIAIGGAFMRKWRIAAFAVFALVVESATYRATSLVVPRERPDVKRLEDLPADASYPSGHTAAAVAVYVGVVLLITSRLSTRALRVAAWAIAIPLVVALARMYASPGRRSAHGGVGARAREAPSHSARCSTPRGAGRRRRRACPCSPPASGSTPACRDRPGSRPSRPGWSRPSATQIEPAPILSSQS